MKKMFGDHPSRIPAACYLRIGIVVGGPCREPLCMYCLAIRYTQSVCRGHSRGFRSRSASQDPKEAARCVYVRGRERECVCEIERDRERERGQMQKHGCLRALEPFRKAARACQPRVLAACCPLQQPRPRTRQVHVPHPADGDKRQGGRATSRLHMSTCPCPHAHMLNVLEGGEMLCVGVWGAGRGHSCVAGASECGVLRGRALGGTMCSVVDVLCTLHNSVRTMPAVLSLCYSSLG